MDIVFRTKWDHLELCVVPDDKEECFLLGLVASKAGKFNIEYDRPLGGPTDLESLVIRKAGLLNLFSLIAERRCEDGSRISDEREDWHVLGELKQMEKELRQKTVKLEGAENLIYEAIRFQSNWHMHEGWHKRAEAVLGRERYNDAMQGQEGQAGQGPAEKEKEG